jgi:hypothetical protein
MQVHGYLGFTSTAAKETTPSNQRKVSPEVFIIGNQRSGDADQIVLRTKATKLNNNDKIREALYHKRKARKDLGRQLANLASQVASLTNTVKDLVQQLQECNASATITTAAAATATEQPTADGLR